MVGGREGLASRVDGQMGQWIKGGGQRRASAKLSLCFGLTSLSACSVQQGRAG